MATAVQVLQEAESVYSYPKSGGIFVRLKRANVIQLMGYFDKNAITVNYGGHAAINQRRCAAICSS